jgi:hypothetical protein
MYEETQYELEYYVASTKLTLKTLAQQYIAECQVLQSRVESNNTEDSSTSNTVSTTDLASVQESMEEISDIISNIKTTLWL